MLFNIKLKKLRAHTGLTQEEFAQKIGVSRSAYSLYETGQREPDFKVLKNIANVCNVSADYLIDDDYTVPVSSAHLSEDEVTLINLYRTIGGGIVDDKEFQVIRMYRDLSPEERGEVRGLMRGLALKRQENVTKKVVPE